MAAATGAWAAELGLRALVVSTDAAHSLADALLLPHGVRRHELGAGLVVEQLDARARLEEVWAEVREWLVGLVGRAGLDRTRAEELTVVPGLEELLALGEVVDRAESGAHDVIVVDCAPSAETIRLLSMPEVMGWWMRRLGPARTQLLSTVGPLVEQVTDLPVPGLEVVEQADAVVERLARAGTLLTDPATTSARIVLTPEGMVIDEARRTHTYLSLFGHRVDAVVANRLLPDEVADPWFDRWKVAQAEHLVTIREAFAPLPILEVALRPSEPRGRDALVELGRQLYAGDDPTGLLDASAPLRLDTGDGQPVLVVELPGVDRDDVDVGRRGDEILVTVGAYRRAILLPDSLRGRAVTGASVTGGELSVTFGPRGGS